MAAPYKTVNEFLEILHQAFEQACHQSPNDPELKRVKDEIDTATAADKPGEAEAALRKWYSKRRV